MTGDDGTGSLWRALAVARLVLLGYAATINVLQWQGYERPGLAWVVFAAIAAWSVAAPWLYAAPRRRPWLLGLELALGVGALLVTPYAEGSAMLARDASTIPTYWIAAPVIGWAIQWGWRGGLLAALIEAAVDVAIRVEPTGTTAGNIFLLVVTGLTVGYAASLVQISTLERAEATALSAATRERERLSRAVHDGVLQVLSYVQRRGTEIGGPTAELAELAAEQEEALRGLVQGGLVPGTDHGCGEVTPAVSDVAGLLQRHTSRTVSVAIPAEPVPLPTRTAVELVAAVREALDNTTRHAAGAAAYVLLEDEGDAVVVSVHDDGPGIPSGRLGEAAAAGRMGVAGSIVARLAELGGAASLTTEPDAGTEWELRVPREPGSRQ
ncbi:MAG: MacS family sensor histidine kinase [Pseudonocardiaceae bacterium]